MTQAQRVDIRKSHSEVLRVERSTFMGKELINMRLWFYSDDGELRPTKKGFALNIDKLEELIEALEIMRNA